MEKVIRWGFLGCGKVVHKKSGDAFRKVPNSTIAAIRRRSLEEAKKSAEYFGAPFWCDSVEELLAQDIDAVYIATPPGLHYEQAMQCLKAGKAVYLEKPFARNRYECDNLIRIAKEKNVTLAVFHQSLFAPIYTEAKKVYESGKLGKIKQIDITYNGFARRWDWQTSQVEMGGSIYNTGPHPIGYGLGFLDFDPDFKVIYSNLDNVITSGDADDYAKILITAPNKPLVDIEVTSIDAYAAPVFKILGSKGTFKSTFKEWEVKYMVDGENPEQKLILNPLKDENGLPAYCSEDLITHEEKGEINGSAFDVGTKCFYEMVYNAIVNNKEMEIKPEHAAMVISVIEQAHAENPLPVKF